MPPFIRAIATALAMVVLASVPLARSAAAQAPAGAAHLALSVDASAGPMAPRVPPRRRGALELAFGATFIVGSAGLGVLGALLHGPPLFCGLDLWGDGGDTSDCVPQGGGGPAFALSAIAGVTGIALVTVGGITVHRRRAMLRATAGQGAALSFELVY